MYGEDEEMVGDRSVFLGRTLRLYTFAIMSYWSSNGYLGGPNVGGLTGLSQECGAWQLGLGSTFFSGWPSHFAFILLYGGVLE